MFALGSDDYGTRLMFRCGLMTGRSLSRFLCREGDKSSIGVLWTLLLTTADTGEALSAKVLTAVVQMG